MDIIERDASRAKAMGCVLRPMEGRDIVQAAEIEREAFPTMWPPTSFKRELSSNRLARYLVVCGPREEADSPSAPAPRSLIGAPRRTRLGRLIAAVGRRLGSGGARAEEPPPEPQDPVWGYVGIWFMADEAHITGVATRQTHQRQGIGELLLIGTVELAQVRGTRSVTLEARVSNSIAQALYRKYGFKEMGIRKRYYSDNAEDAVIMSTDAISSREYLELFQGLVVRHRERWGTTERVLS